MSLRKEDQSQVRKGVLDPYFETGTEGIVWSLCEDGKEGYDGLNILEKGDQLKVYGEKGNILFDGVIDPDWKAGWKEYPKNPGHGQPCALGYWIHWTQRGWEPDLWARLFIRRKDEKPLRAELTKCKRAS